MNLIPDRGTLWESVVAWVVVIGAIFLVSAAVAVLKAIVDSATFS